MEHPPCSCTAPTESCPRYGSMLGRHFQVCQGIAVDPDKRPLLLDAYLGIRHTTPSPPGGLSLKRNPSGGGPGTELREMLAALDLKGSSGCGCNDLSSRMDTWGAEGCRSHRQEILEQLRKAQKNAGWIEKIKATALAIRSGLAFRLDPLDPLGSLLDEAIRRAEAKEPSTAPFPVSVESSP